MKKKLNLSYFLTKSLCCTEHHSWSLIVNYSAAKDRNQKSINVLSVSATCNLYFGNTCKKIERKLCLTPTVSNFSVHQNIKEKIRKYTFTSSSSSKKCVLSLLLSLNNLNSQGDPRSNR